MPQHEPGRGLKASWEWLQFAAGLPATPLAVPPGGGSGLIVSGRVILTGVSVTSSATAAGTATLYDGLDVKGTAIDTLQLPAGGAAQRPYSPRGILCEEGIFVSVTTAVLAGSIWYIPLWQYPWSPPGG